MTRHATRLLPGDGASPSRNLRRLLLAGFLLLAAPCFAQQAPALHWTTLDGSSASLEQWKGRPVLLNFWASWCGPCLKELPDLQRLSQAQGKVPGGLRVVGVALDEADAAAALRDQLKLTYPQLVEPDGPPGSAARFGNSAGTLPFSVLLDGEGRVLRTHHRPLDAAELAQWAAIAGTAK